MSGRDEVPVGRRMAELRARRGMSQQVFADRIGRSKSWVDRVERGVRTLDRLSVIETVAGALGVAPNVLLADEPRRKPGTDVSVAVERIRAALARHDPPDADGPTVRQLDDQAEYAWAAYRKGHHPQVLRTLPDLLAAIRHSHHTPTGDASAPDPLVRVYRLAAQTLVKLGEPHLGLLAADRAMMAATGDPHRTGLAAVSFAQALRALRRGRLAQAAALSAVHQLDRTPSRAFLPDGPGLTGTLLIEAALAAATCGDAATAHDLTERAVDLAAAHGNRQYDGDGVAFGPVAVTLARALAATHLGDHHVPSRSTVTPPTARGGTGSPPSIAPPTSSTSPAPTSTSATRRLPAVLSSPPTASPPPRLAPAPPPGSPSPRFFAPVPPPPTSPAWPPSSA
ncbi:helix-turn-helix domain-containing protein [Micromonospora sp. PTRAS2]